MKSRTFNPPLDVEDCNDLYAISVLAQALRDLSVFTDNPLYRDIACVIIQKANKVADKLSAALPK